MFSYSPEAPKYINKSTQRCKSNSPHAKTIIVRKGDFIKQYDSITEAAEELGLKYSLISAVLTGRQRTTSGYSMQYNNDRTNCSAQLAD